MHPQLTAIELESYGQRSSLKRDEFLRFTAGPVEPRQIGPHVRVVCQGCENRIQNGICRSVLRSLDAVVHPFSFAPRTDDARIPQIGEMPGNLWLPLFQDFHEVTDAYFSPCHKVEQPEAGRVSQGGEEADQIEGFGTSSHAKYYIRIDTCVVVLIYSR